MVTHLILGCEPPGRRVIERYIELHDGDILVICDDSDIVSAFREENVPAIHGDPTDASELDEIESPSVVLVVTATLAETRMTLEHVSEQFPASITLVALDSSYPHPISTSNDERETNRLERAPPSTRTEAASSDIEVITDLADRIIDATAIVREETLERTVYQTAIQTIKLRAQLASIDGRLAVVTHDNPDPDAIASAVALVDIAEFVGIEADACYYGEITHQENRAMVNLLDLDLVNLERDDPLGIYDGFALVDHSRPGVNDQLPEEIHVDIVIDHHPPRGPVPGVFTDLREGVGATSSILAGYMEQFSFDVDPRTATALLYGIWVDTDDFRREVAPADYHAASILQPHVDESMLEKIEQPSIEGETFEVISRAIKNRTVEGTVAVSSVGQITSRDVLPQAADQLLAMEGVDSTLVFGFDESMVYLSARSRTSTIDLGETLRDAFGQIGSAGGHADMAGAQLEIGILGELEETVDVESIVAVVEDVITDRFFEAFRTRPGTSIRSPSGASRWLFSNPDDGSEADEE